MFVWNKISTQSYSAKFLYWGDHVNSVPDPAASPPWPSHLSSINFSLFSGKWNKDVAIAVLTGILKQFWIKPGKRISGLQQDLNPWTLNLRYSARPTELWRPIRWEQANLSSSSLKKGTKHRMKMMWALEIQMKSGLEINFVEYWPIGYLSQILTGQTVSFTGHM